MASGSTVSGVWPDRPSRMATSVAWPLPVKAREPNSSQRTWVGGETAVASSAKVRAARMGPTVCELDGPTPMVKRSLTLKGEALWGDALGASGGTVVMAHPCNR